MKKAQKVSEKLSCVDLAAVVLGSSNVRCFDNEPNPEPVGAYVKEKLSNVEAYVIFHRFNIPYKGVLLSPISNIAKELRDESIFRAVEESAIKRLQERDCFSYFVKKFGSKELIMEIISQEAKLGHDASLVFDDDDLVDKATESELAQFLEAMETVHDFCRRWARRGVENSL